jgi:hypothetical protein
MVVVGITHPEQAAEMVLRLAAVQGCEVYQERIASDETLFAVRIQDLTEAQHLSGLLYRAGAQQIDIDHDAA